MAADAHYELMAELLVDAHEGSHPFRSPRVGVDLTEVEARVTAVHLQQA